MCSCGKGEKEKSEEARQGDIHSGDCSDKETVNCNEKPIESKVIDTSPSSGYNSSMTESLENDNEGDTSTGVAECDDLLLIDLTTPKEEKQASWSQVSLNCADEDLDHSFTE